MDINFEKNQITLYGKVCKLDTLIRKLATLSGEQVYHFLNNRGILLPRRMNCMAMTSVLNSKIKFLHSNSLTKDGFVKLQYYSSYTEQQLFMLFNKICDETDFAKYRYNLFELIMNNYVAMDLQDGELNYIRNLKKTPMESFPDYFNFISGACLEQENTFDGQDIDVLKNNLQYSATNQDIFDLGAKYGIEIPQRLKQPEFLEFIVYTLKRNGKYTQVIADELALMNITQLTTYAKRMGIAMQPNMSKTDLITYLFYYLEQCEIEKTSVRRIESAPKYEPLEFKVDLQAVNNFGLGEAKKIIHYQGEQEDEERFNQVIAEENAPEEPEEEEIPEEAADSAETPIVSEDAMVQPGQEVSVVEAESADEAKEMEDTLAQDIINETLAGVKEKNPEDDDINLDEFKMNIRTDCTEENPEYETGKIEKLVQSNSKLVMLIIGAVLCLCIMGFCVWALVLQ